MTCIARLRAKDGVAQDLGQDGKRVGVVDKNQKVAKWYKFDHVFDDVHSTSEIFDSCFSGYLSSIVGGINVSLFLYGSSDTGKEYTLKDNAKELGLISQLSEGIFKCMEQKVAHDSNFKYQVRLKYFQVYEEEAHDLLGPDGRGHGMDAVTVDQWEGACVQAITWAAVTSREQVTALQAKGNQRRNPDH